MIQIKNCVICFYFRLFVRKFSFTMSKNTIFIIFIACFHGLFAQNEITLHFPQNAVSVEKQNHLLLYEYQSPEINVFAKKYKIALPENLKNSQTAFGFVNFGGWKNDDLSGNTLIAVSQYLFGKPVIYVDFNHNLDLRDDAMPLIFNNLRDTVTFSLFNPEAAGANVTYKLFYPQYESPQAAKQIETILGKTGVGRDNKVLPVQYWLSYAAANSFVIDTTVDSVNIRIGLYDENKNGLFNDENDRIMIGDVISKKISPSLSDGAVSYTPNCVIRLQNKSYKVLEIGANGDFMRLQATEEDALRMFEGEKVIDFPFKRVDAEPTTLYEQLNAEKYTVLYFWGLWCKNCQTSTSKLATLSARYSGKMQVIAMNVGDHTDNIRKHFFAHNLQWLNGIATKDILTIFLTDTYPTCVLISPDKKILRFNASMEEIEAYMRR